MTILSTNSQIFSTTVLGVNSGDTASNTSSRVRQVQEDYLKSSIVSNLGTKLPIVPSNQRKATR